MYKKRYEFLAEFIGCIFLLTIGGGVVASTLLFAPAENGGFTNITIAWGFAVTFGVYVSGRISGGHLNPAVTIALTATKRFPLNKVWYYILAQVMGCFIGAAIVFGVYYKQWLTFDPNLASTAGIVTTFPTLPGVWSGFFDQIVGTFILMYLVLVMGDANNTPPGANLGAIFVGFIVVAIGMSFGTLHGYAINPARDFGPRLFTVLAGFKNNGLTDGSNVWIIPIIAPIMGATLAAFTYDITIGKALSSKK